MLAIDDAAAGRHRAASEPFDAEQLEPDRGADEVGDRIEGADLVEMHFLDRNPVDLGLGVGQAAEEALGQILLTIGQPALVDNCLDVMQVSMGVVVRRLDPRVSCRDATALDPLQPQCDRQAERIEPGPDGVGVHAGVD